ncbi:putative mucin binding protein [Paramicrosporidium saccamoebae]|uniref:Putative mucin binding protein n=1 Tax=Paramicrosporidium saccamoebae TaxID=1246581 RepID=A0A2H9THH7_9FUNG|nr:putative mucin binding protein [Paramicrosporidium saccamoebae]
MSCLEHKKCPTGFCKAGKCVNPGADDPCLGEYDYPGYDTCPAGFKCHISEGRCRVEGYKPPFSCSSDLDCGISYFCGRSGICEFRTSGSCSSQKCWDGYDCVNGKCLSRCFSQDNCFSGESCQAGPLKGFKVCTPKEKLNPVKPPKPFKPVKPVKPAKPVKPVKPAKPPKPLKPVEPPKPIDPVGPFGSIGSNGTDSGNNSSGYSTTDMLLFGGGGIVVLVIIITILIIAIRKCGRKKDDPQAIHGSHYYSHPSSPSMPAYHHQSPMYQHSINSAHSPVYQSDYATQHVAQDATLPSYSEVQSQAYQNPPYSEKI